MYIDFIKEIFKINAFHQYAHKDDCAKEFSIRNTPQVGRLCGEETEVPWAVLNHLQPSTREMNAGPRRDLISVHMEYQNLKKILKMGKIFSGVNKDTDFCH